MAYIDKELFKQDIKMRYCNNCANPNEIKCRCCNVDDLLGEIEDAPIADVAEVVRCRDCKYLYCFSAIDRQFYCKHFPKGLQGINIVEDNPFCSYGERK